MSERALQHRNKELIFNDSTYYSKLWNLNPKIRLILYNNVNNLQKINILYSYSQNTWVLRFLIDDIKKYIDEYIPHYMECNLNIHYPKDYPFKPPKWKLESYKCSIYKKQNIEKNLVKSLKLFNCVDHSWDVWSPATSISGDILSFMVTFQKFIEENEL